MSTKTWFVAYFAVYLAVGIAIIVTVGPRGFSEEYLAQFGDEHEHYLEVTRGTEYRLWKERPHLHPLDASLEQDVAFVQRYEGREAFQAEQARRKLFDTLFDFFNFLMVTYLIVHFARRPLARFLDERIEETRARVAEAEQARADALQARAEAEARIGGLATEAAALAERNAALIEEDRQKLEDFTRLGLSEIDQEAEQRRQAEVLAAKRQVRAELVEQAVQQLLERYAAEATPERVTRLTRQFAAELEKRA